MLTGCRPGNPGTPGALGLPAENQVRILSRRVKQTEDTLHWKWSLIGERNWMTPGNQNGSISLEKTVPLNDTNLKGGCNIWEVDLEAKRSGSTIEWQTRLHGSNGMTAKDTGNVPGDIRSVQVLMEKDQVISLPVDLSLVKIGEKEIRWRIAR